MLMNHWILTLVKDSCFKSTEQCLEGYFLLRKVFSTLCLEGYLLLRKVFSTVCLEGYLLLRKEEQ